MNESPLKRGKVKVCSHFLMRDTQKGHTCCTLLTGVLFHELTGVLFHELTGVLFRELTGVLFHELTGVLFHDPVGTFDGGRACKRAAERKLSSVTSTERIRH